MDGLIFQNLSYIFQFSTQDLLINLLLLIFLDKTIIYSKFAQVLHTLLLCYIHFIFYFFMNINAFLFNILMKILSPLTLISPTIILFLFFLYSFFKKTYDFINSVFDLPYSYHPFISFFEFYLVVVIFILFLSIPSFFITINF